ncbi:MAG: LamG domain-containing protein, partial [Planctomycetaceae bacterium]|nr:LamG domain-containing protein [Planctomycetaceae bacterium]
MRDSTSILSRYAKRLFGASATTSRRRRDAVRRRDHLPLHTPAEVLEERSLLSGVVAYWAAENTAVDAVGANNGALINGATYSAGQMGQAFSFDGVNDRVQVADSASLKLTASMSIEGWVKADSVPVPGQQGEILFRGDDRGGLDPYSLSVQSSGGLRFEVVSLSAAVSVSTPMPLGQFVHIAATLDDASGAMSLYLNGVLMSQTTTTVRPFGDLDPASNPSIGIGNHGGYPTSPHNFPFAALIDELKVYDQA